MVVLDISITNVALPTIKQQLHFSNVTLQWVITAYALTFGGFLLLGGRAADLFGRRRILTYGIAAFTTFSFLIGVSRSEAMLIILRALQGAAAAFMSPSALSIVVVTFTDGEERNRALAYWTLVATGGAAVGLLLGGLLTQFISWQWDFFVNVPVGIAIFFAIRGLVPKDRVEEHHKNLDIVGAFLITISLMLQVLAFSQATNWHWLSVRTLGALAVAVILLIAFFYNESRAKHPLMPLSIFKIRNVVGANAMMAPLYGTMLGMFFLTTLFFQNISRYSPVKTGLGFLPFPVILAFMSTQIPTWVGRFGYKRFLMIGPIIIALSLLWMGRLPVHASYIKDLLPVFIVMPIGVGLVYMPVYAAATSGLPRDEAGLASGLINTSQQMGGALGLAILSSVAASVTAGSRLNADDATVHGFDIAYLAAIAFMLAAAFIAAGVIKQSKEKSSHSIAVGG